MKMAFPSEYKSLRKRIDPLPPELSRIGYSSRYKILRTAQLHYFDPPVDAAAQALTPLFLHFETHSTGNQWMLQQYNAIRWALDYKDNDLASSALLRFGQISWNSTGPPFELPSIHRITKTSAGVECTILTDHTLQERMEAACQAILMHYQGDLISNTPPSFSRYFKVGCAAFYTYRRSYVTLPPELNQSAKARIQAYIENLFNKLSDVLPNQVPYATMDDPDEWLHPDYSFFLPWEAFNFTSGATAKQYAQRQNAARNSCLAAITRAIPSNADPHKVYQRQEILNWIGKNQITHAVKHGFLTPGEKRGTYYLTFLQPDDDTEKEV